MINKMKDQITDFLETEKNNVYYTLRVMFIHFIIPLNSFTFPVFYNSGNTCNLTMKHLFRFGLNLSKV